MQPSSGSMLLKPRNFKGSVKIGAKYFEKIVQINNKEGTNL
jgi:hypothetical protein